MGRDRSLYVWAPEGASVARNVQIEHWSVLQAAKPSNGLWRLDVTRAARGARKYFQIDFTGAPALLWLSAEKTVAY